MSQPLWVEVAEFLLSSLAQIDDSTIDGAGHLLQIERPEAVAREKAELLASNSMAGDRRALFA